MPLMAMPYGVCSLFQNGVFPRAPYLQQAAACLVERCRSTRPLCFAEGLNQAESAVLHDQMERVDGHPCYVVEAMASDHSHKTLAWVDFQRDYRIL